jgi:hypothetical protein
VASRLAHVGTGRPVFHLPKKFRQSFARSLGVRPDRAVWEVRHVSDQPQPPRRVVREVPKTDTLNAARDPHL